MFIDELVEIEDKRILVADDKRAASKEPRREESGARHLSGTCSRWNLWRAASRAACGRPRAVPFALTRGDGLAARGGVAGMVGATIWMCWA
jgi:hypothetical protein